MSLFQEHYEMYSTVLFFRFFPLLLKLIGYPNSLFDQKLCSAVPVGCQPNSPLQYFLGNCIFSLL